MYTLVSAFAKPSQDKNRWLTVDIGNTPMSELFLQYEKVYATLTHPVLTDPVTLDLEHLRGKWAASTATFNEMLVAIGDDSLPTQAAITGIVTKHIRYMDAVAAGYKIKAVSPTASSDTELPIGDRPWFHLSRKDPYGVDTDYELFQKHALVTVNGFYHLTDFDSTGVLVVDGSKTARAPKSQARGTTVGITSFMALGEIKLYPITQNVVGKLNDETLLSDTALLSLPAEVGDKTLFVVIGGYLNPIDNRIFRRTADNQIAIDFANYPLLNRYFESQQYLDFSELGLTEAEFNPVSVNVGELFSDEVMVKYLTMSQSFVVALDNADVYTEHAYVQRERFPGHFVSFVKPQWPLMTGHGMVADYWYEEDHGQYVLTCMDNYWHMRGYNTANAQNLVNVSDQRVPADPVRYSRGFFLKVQSDQLQGLA